MRKFIRIATVLALFVPAAAQASDVLLLDVRTPGEFSQAHYPQSTNIDYRILPQKLGGLASSKDQPVLLYCRSGRRASVVKQQLESMGYTDIRNLGGLHEVVALCDPSDKPSKICSPNQLEKLSR